MKRFVEGTDRGQSTLFPDCLEDARPIMSILDLDLPPTLLARADEARVHHAAQQRCSVAALSALNEVSTRINLAEGFHTARTHSGSLRLPGCHCRHWPTVVFELANSAPSWKPSLSRPRRASLACTSVQSVA
jgi:hypothetical protein